MLSWEVLGVVNSWIGDILLGLVVIICATEQRLVTRSLVEDAVSGVRQSQQWSLHMACGNECQRSRWRMLQSRSLESCKMYKNLAWKNFPATLTLQNEMLIRAILLSPSLHLLVVHLPGLESAQLAAIACVRKES